MKTREEVVALNEAHQAELGRIPAVVVDEIEAAECPVIFKMLRLMRDVLRVTSNTVPSLFKKCLVGEGYWKIGTLFSCADLPDRNTILDIGAGIGKKKWMIDQVFPDVQYHGIDLLYESKELDIIFMAVEDLCAVPMYSLCFSHQVLEHVANPEIALNAIFDAMLPGGVYGQATPSPWTLGDVDSEPAHISQFTTAKWRELFEKTGFVVVETYIDLQHVGRASAIMIAVKPGTDAEK